MIFGNELYQWTTIILIAINWRHEKSIIIEIEISPLFNFLPKNAVNNIRYSIHNVFRLVKWSICCANIWRPLSSLKPLHWFRMYETWCRFDVHVVFRCLNNFFLNVNLTERKKNFIISAHFGRHTVCCTHYNCWIPWVYYKK